jgi:xanthine dehydrogenase YagT iron-sulfur-binding subunit
MINEESGDGPVSISRRKILAAAAVAGAGAAIAPLLSGCAHSQTSSASAEPMNQPSLPNGMMQTTLNVNGQNHSLTIEPRVTLLDALREDVGLTGTKKGCDHGQCGACTVLCDGRRINSCLTLAVMVQGQKITTIEGLANGDELHPLQAAFIKHDAFQCGYCTPGQICSGVGLIHEGHAKTDDDIREQMSGNICRCGAYPNIVRAIKSVIAETDSAVAKPPPINTAAVASATSGS